MWLILDIGNSAVKGGFFEGERLEAPFRLELSPEAPPEDWQAALADQVKDRPITRAGLTSVVPALTARLQPLLGRLTNGAVQVIDYRMKLPFTLAYETPETMGADRLAAAAAAWTAYGVAADGSTRPVVALDAGTAVTCEVVDQGGVFRGGAIGAGPRLLRDALHRGTAQLPPVPLSLPPTPIGRTTQEALQVGIMYPFLDGVRGLLVRIRETLGERPVVVATGGWSSMLHDHLDAVDHVDPHLVLRGIQVLMALNEQ